jgi:tetratricopeptide (TPR) repeat protein
MMNTKIYKSVHGLAERLMKAADNEDRVAFELLYDELNSICMDNEHASKDHPVQWETLADFTEDLTSAIIIYEKALAKSVSIDSKDHISSVAYSMATLHIELGQVEQAIKNLQQAQISANKIEDNELKREVDELLATLLES